MARASYAQTKERIDDAKEQLRAGTHRATVIGHIAQSYGLTVRQARRIVTQAEEGHTPRKALEPRPEAGTVYVLQHKLTGMIKVGATLCFERRWGTFSQTCRILKTAEVKDYRKAERALLASIAPWRLPGTEWAAPCAALVVL